jgi:predicted thioesterase
MERAATICAATQLAEGKFTVGFEVCVKHFGAAIEGATCTAKAVLTNVEEDRKFFFDVEVSEGERPIGSGTHQRRSPRV